MKWNGTTLARGAIKWKKGAMKDIQAGVGKVFKGVIGNNVKEVGLEPFTSCCKEWKAGTDLPRPLSID